MQVVIILAKSFLNSSAYVIISATREARNDKNLFSVVSSMYVHRSMTMQKCRKKCRKPANWIAESANRIRNTFFHTKFSSFWSRAT